MTLSEAIRLGSLLNPQAFGYFQSLKFDTPGIVYTCALGAAGKAINVDCREELLPWAILGALYLKRCPAYKCKQEPVTVATAIVHLNDDHKWTCEAIADWVESVEKTTGVAKEASAKDQSLTTQEVQYEAK